MDKNSSNSMVGNHGRVGTIAAAPVTAPKGRTASPYPCYLIAEGKLECLQWWQQRRLRNGECRWASKCAPTPSAEATT